MVASSAPFPGLSSGKEDRLPTGQKVWENVVRFTVAPGAPRWKTHLPRQETAGAPFLPRSVPPQRCGRPPPNSHQRSRRPFPPGPRRRLPRNLVDRGADGEADPLPVGREERSDGSLRAREFGGGRLVQATGEQTWRRAGDVDQPRAIGRNGDAAPAVSNRRERRVGAQIDIQPHQRPMVGCFARHGAHNAMPSAATNTAATAGQGARHDGPWRGHRGQRRVREYDGFKRAVERQAHIANVAHTLLRVLPQAQAERLTDAGRDRGGQHLPLGFQADDRAKYFGHVLAIERAVPRQHLEEHRAERPDVGALVHDLAARLLRRHVRGGAEDHPGLRHCWRRDGRRLRQRVWALRVASGFSRTLHRLREPEVQAPSPCRRRGP